MRGAGRREREWSGRLSQNTVRFACPLKEFTFFPPQASGKLLFLSRRMTLSHLQKFLPFSEGDTF